MEADLKVFENGERDRLLRGLGQAYLMAGDPESAARLWRELAHSLPGDLKCAYQLMELAHLGSPKDLEQRERPGKTA